MSPIERIEQALKERYNVRELPEHLASAVAAAKKGALGSLENVLDGRELYRWRDGVDEALQEARRELANAVAPKATSRAKKPEEPAPESHEEPTSLKQEA